MADIEVSQDSEGVTIRQGRRNMLFWEILGAAVSLLLLLAFPRILLRVFELPTWLENPIVVVFVALWGASVAHRYWTAGPETWRFTPGEIDYRRETRMGVIRKTWHADGFKEIGYRARRFDGPDLYRLELRIAGDDGRLILRWMKSQEERDELGARFESMFPQTGVNWMD